MDQWLVEFADNIPDFFPNLGVLDMEDNIKRTIKFSLSYKVVISWMEKIHYFKIVLLNKMAKNIDSGDILRVNISISPYVNKRVLFRVQNVFQARVKTGEGREKLVFLA